MLCKKVGLQRKSKNIGSPPMIKALWNDNSSREFNCLLMQTGGGRETSFTFISYHRLFCKGVLHPSAHPNKDKSPWPRRYSVSIIIGVGLQGERDRFLRLAKRKNRHTSPMQGNRGKRFECHSAKKRGDGFYILPHYLSPNRLNLPTQKILWSRADTLAQGCRGWRKSPAKHRRTPMIKAVWYDN